MPFDAAALKNDQSFMALATEEKIKALRGVDPTFAALAPEEQQKGVVRLYGDDVASRARQHLKGIAAGTDVPRGTLTPAAPDAEATTATGVPLQQGGHDPTAVQSLGTALNPMPLVETVGKLMSPVPGMGQAEMSRLVHGQIDQVKTAHAKASQHRDLAMDALMAGDVPGYLSHTSQGFGHALAAVLPLIGPMAEHAGETISGGNISGGLAEATPLVAGLVGKVPGVAAVGDALKARGAAMAGNAVTTLTDYLLKGKNASPEVRAAAEAIAKRIVSEHATMTNPQAEIAADGQSQINAADASMDRAVGSTPPIDPSEVTRSAQAVMDARIDPAGREIGPYAKTINAQTGDYLQRSVTGTPPKPLPPVELYDASGNRIPPRPAPEFKPAPIDATDLLDSKRKYMGAAANEADGSVARESLADVGNAQMKALAGANPDIAAANEAMRKGLVVRDQLAPMTPGAQPPLNVWPRLLKAAATAAAAPAANALMPGVGHTLVNAVAGGGTLAQIGSLARDIMTGPTFRTWSAGAKASFGQSVIAAGAAMTPENLGAIMANAARADMASRGIDDPGFGAVAHLTPKDTAHLYNGGQAVYIDPDGKVTPVTLEATDASLNP